MSWQRRLVVLLVVLALVGCTQGLAGQAGVPNAPHSPQDNSNTRVAMATACNWQGTGKVIRY
jgi:hypothetical protein